MTTKVEHAQSAVDSMEIARACQSFNSEFRDVYPDTVRRQLCAVGPMQAFIGHFLQLRDAAKEPSS